MLPSHIVQWYIPNRVLVMQFWGDSSQEDIIQSIDQANKLLASVENDRLTIHHILDLRAVSKALPLRDIPSIVSKVKFASKNGWIIVINNSNQIIRFSASVAQQLLHLRGRSVATPKEALEILQIIDDTLDWSQADMQIFNGQQSISA